MTEVEALKALTWKAIEIHVNSTGLSQYKGGIAPRNAFNSPWNSSLDLRITQDIDTGVGKVILYLDITNILNLLNEDRGIIREYSNRSRQIILDEDNPYDSQGRYNIVGVDSIVSPDDYELEYKNNFTRIMVGDDLVAKVTGTFTEI